MLKTVIVAGVLIVVAYILIVVAAALLFFVLAPRALRAEVGKYQGLIAASMTGLAAVFAYVGVLVTIAVQTENVDRQLAEVAKRITADDDARRAAFARSLGRDLEVALQPTHDIQADISNGRFQLPDDASERVKYLKRYEAEIPPRLDGDPLLLGLLSSFAQRLVHSLSWQLRRYNSQIEGARS